MAGNSFGTAFRLLTWGESHGPAIGCVLDGVPPGITLAESDVQRDLDRRRPGTSRHTSQRREPDTVRIESGVFEGRTTGTPLAMVIQNQDARSSDYERHRTVFRPAHADYTYWKKYGVRDHRGGGRSSARETAMRVAAGAVARRVIAPVRVRGALVQLGPLAIDRDRWDWEAVDRNPFFCPDPETVAAWETYLDQIRGERSSCGAVVEVQAENVPVGLGEPVYDRLDADLARAMMGINAVKGVEIGAGFAAAAQTGVEHADEMRAGPDPGDVTFLSNNAGGILGGISSGQPIVVRFAVKPTSSIPQPRRTVDRDGNDTEIVTTGRHDPCVGIRAVPIGEAMLALVLADHLIRHRGMVAGMPTD